MAELLQINPHRSFSSTLRLSIMYISAVIVIFAALLFVIYNVIFSDLPGLGFELWGFHVFIVLPAIFFGVIASIATYLKEKEKGLKSSDYYFSIIFLFGEPLYFIYFLLPK